MSKQAAKTIELQLRALGYVDEPASSEEFITLGRKDLGVIIMIGTVLVLLLAGTYYEGMDYSRHSIEDIMKKIISIKGVSQ